MAHCDTDTSKTLSETAREQVRRTADDAKDTVKRELKSHAEDMRDNAATETQKVANAADAAAQEFDAGTLQAQAASQVADALEQVAAQVRTTDLDRLARTASGFARENPALFVGGAALLGLAATRFLKARAPQAERPVAAAARAYHDASTWQDDDDPWGAHGSANLTGRGAV